MASRSASKLGVLLGLLVAAVVAVVLVLRGRATPEARADTAPPPVPPPTATANLSSAWCGNGVEALPADVCYIDGREGAARRTLVIWLHGVIGKTTSWSQDHVKMLTRVSKTTDIEMLFPKGTLGESTYAWPGTPEAREKDEAGLIAQWMTAKDILEKRENKRFDETFIFGFSSGAYYASSLAMRGAAEVDGYAVFAGGQPAPPETTRPARLVPVFVGVCADDKTTASHSRAFAGSLGAAGIPFTVNEQSVGHDLSPAHFTNALAFLRKSKTAP